MTGLDTLEGRIRAIQREEKTKFRAKHGSTKPARRADVDPDAEQVSCAPRRHVSSPRVAAVAVCPIRATAL
jgi:hypothetical protein